MPTKRELLASVEIFRDLSAELREEIIGLCQEKTYSRGETVFSEGGRPERLIIVWRGAVKIFKLGPSGREQILEIEGPGQTVAALPLFDGGPYPASCTALEDSLLLTMPATTFHRLLASEPAVARSVIIHLAGRLRRMVSLIHQISLKDVRARLAELLLEMAGDGDTVELSLTHQEIAARIGTVREIVSRTLGRMVQDGALRLEGRSVTIIERSRLEGGGE
jgi:CRP/FNR family transcriptional regulator